MVGRSYSFAGELPAGGGPTQLPRVQVPGEQHHGYGRPRRQDADPERAAHVAWLVDACGWTYYRCAKALDGEPDQAARQRAKRWAVAGRRLLHAQGVLPWAAYDDGAVPPRWWEDVTWLAALARWRHDARMAAVLRAARPT